MPMVGEVLLCPWTNLLRDRQAVGQSDSGTCGGTEKKGDRAQAEQYRSISCRDLWGYQLLWVMEQGSSGSPWLGQTYWERGSLWGLEAGPDNIYKPRQLVLF